MSPRHEDKVAVIREHGWSLFESYDDLISGITPLLTLSNLFYFAFSLVLVTLFLPIFASLLSYISL